MGEGLRQNTTLVDFILAHTRLLKDKLPWTCMVWTNGQYLKDSTKDLPQGETAIYLLAITVAN
jgi:hypothetical protein